MERADYKLTTPKWIINESVCRYEFASQFVDGRVVVDAACGSGYGVKLLLKSDPKMIFGFDISPQSIKKNRERYRKAAKNRVKFEIADVTKLPCNQQSADVFVSLETIEHLRQVNRYLVEVKRVLRPQGIFICSTPNRSVTNPGLRLKQRPFNPYHLFEYSKQEFFKKMKENFKQCELYGQNINSDKKINHLIKWASWTSPRLIARMRQLAKLPLFIFDSKKRHRVKMIKENEEPEYLVVVCRGPI